LNLIRLGDPFFNDGGWLEQHPNLFQALRYFHDKLGIVKVILTQVTVTQVDATFEVGVVGRHVVRADQVVNACTWPAHGCYHVVSRFYFGDIWTNCFNLAETLMADNQEIVSRGRLAVVSRIDLLVSAINSDAQHSHQHAAPVGNVADLRSWKFR
jgi:hypothetical protein